MGTKGALGWTYHTFNPTRPPPPPHPSACRWAEKGSRQRRRRHCVLALVIVTVGTTDILGFRCLGIDRMIELSDETVEGRASEGFRVVREQGLETFGSGQVVLLVRDAEEATELLHESGAIVGSERLSCEGAGRKLPKRGDVERANCKEVTMSEGTEPSERTYGSD